MNRAPATQSVAPSYPSSSKKAKDWNKLEVEIKQEEKDEKPEGDAALNQ
jgi:suppressor of G2 allele of SKP1